MSKRSKQSIAKRQEFLLSFFDNPHVVYQEKQVNGFWLVRTVQAAGYVVMIYTEDSFKRYKEGGKRSGFSAA